MTARYSFGRMSDAAIMDLIDDLLAAYKSGSATIQLADVTFSITKSEEAGLDQEKRIQFQSLIMEDGYLIVTASWKINGSNVAYHRGRVWGLNSAQQETWLPSPNPYVDSLQLNVTEATAVHVLPVVMRHVGMAPPIVAGGEAGVAMDQAQDILNRVSASIATLVEHTSERQKELDRTRASLAKDAQGAIRNAQAEFDGKVRTIQEDYQKKEAGLTEREKELDDRANTHVRREFAKQMASLSDTRLSANLLTQSQLSFWIPIALAAVPIIALALMIYVEITQISGLSSSISAVIQDAKMRADTKPTILANINSQILYAQIRIGIQSLGLAALIWFALRLASSRYALVSAWERELHKFRLDTERAGFLVEGDLEARKVNERGLPDVLLQSFSRNLFAGTDTHADGDRENMGEALTALLGNAAKVRLGPDGISAEVDGRGLRRARKDMDGE